MNAKGTNGSLCKVPEGAGECQGNERESVQSARGMQVNANKCQVNVWICVQSAWGMQGN